MSKDIRVIRKDCCNIWNNLKDKTQMIDYLIESKQQVADLEAKLAESEKFMKDNGFKNLEELDNYIQNIHLHYDEIKNKGTCGLCEKLDNELINQLKQQLAEKEEELKEFKSIGATPRQLQRAYQERFKYNERCDKLKNQHNQNKINFAVGQLEKVKVALKTFEFNYNGVIDCCEDYVFDIIDNQIKELTHQHEDKGE